ncbi:MAG: chorismate synthase, partial [Nitrospirae bacterium]
VAKGFLSDFGIKIGSYVLQIGKVKVEKPADTEEEELFKRAEDSIVRCFCEKTTDLMKEEIDRAMENGDSLGGVFEVFVKDVPPGIGDHTQWDRRIDGRIAQALMSIQAIKGVEIGGGFALSSLPGSSVMDEIFYSPNEPYGFYRRTNNAGGIEGGMTNGMTIIVRGAMKPIPTLKRPLNSVDILTKEPVKAAYERSDVCAVPSASVIAESMVGMIIADAFLEKFGGDSMEEVHRNYESYIKYLKTF